MNQSDYPRMKCANYKRSPDSYTHKDVIASGSFLNWHTFWTFLQRLMKKQLRQIFLFTVKEKIDFWNTIHSAAGLSFYMALNRADTVMEVVNGIY